MIKLNKKILLLTIALFTLIAISTPTLAESKEIKWNDEHVKWREYKDGMDEAWREGKPVILIIYADWCPACKKYGDVFQDKRVVAESEKFIMIRINKDSNKELSRKYGFDGQYIPRTIAMQANGHVMHEIYKQKTYRYYIGTDAERLLKLMKDAYAAGMG